MFITQQQGVQGRYKIFKMERDSERQFGEFSSRSKEKIYLLNKNISQKQKHNSLIIFFTGKFLFDSKRVPFLDVPDLTGFEVIFQWLQCNKKKNINDQLLAKNNTNLILFSYLISFCSLSLMSQCILPKLNLKILLKFTSSTITKMLQTLADSLNLKSLLRKPIMLLQP